MQQLTEHLLYLRLFSNILFSPYKHPCKRDIDGIIPKGPEGSVTNMPKLHVDELEEEFIEILVLTTSSASNCLQVI